MHNFGLTILGCGSALPSQERFTTAQVLSVQNRNYLIDCGEGTQIQLKRFKVKSSKIEAIFISHLHGDHVFGLPGLITSFCLADRKNPLIIYGPKGIKELMQTVIRLSGSHLTYPLEYMELHHKGILTILESDELKVEAFPVFHRVPTYGYKFTQQNNKLNIDSDKIAEFALSIDEIKAIKSGKDISRKGEIIPNSTLIKKPKSNASYAFTADTIAKERLIDFVQGVDTLYMETTYMDEHRDKAISRGHSTTIQSATIALKSKVHKLIIGHYSSRYKDIKPLVDECTTVFPNTIGAYDGLSIDLQVESSLSSQ